MAKTTLSVNFAASLAERGNKVLLVDLDPQSNTSLWLLGERRFRARIDDRHKTVYQLFLDRIPHVSGGHLKFIFNDAVVKGVAMRGSHCLTPNLDLLPNTFEAIDLEHHLSASQALKHDILKRQLENVESEYNYIVYDCAPNLYMTTVNGLLFSDYYIIPVFPDYFAGAGLSILTRQIKNELDRYHGYVRDLPKLLGIVLTRIKRRATLDIGRKEDLQTALNDLIRQGIVSPDAVVFQTYFNDTVEVPRSIEGFVPSIYHKPSQRTMAEYIRRMNEFTDEVLNKIQ